MVKRLRAALLIAVMIAGANAHAARQGRVDVDQADVYQGPGTDTSVVTQLKKGAPLAVSNLPTNGFYKVRTSSGDIGWVQSDALVLYDGGSVPSGVGDDAFAAPMGGSGSGLLYGKRPNETQETRFKPNIRLRALGGLDLFSQTDFGAITGFDSLSTGFHFGGEAHFLLGRKVSMAVRIEGILKTTVANDTKNNRTYQWDLLSTPVMVGVDIELSSSRRAEFHISAMGGIALNTSLTTTALSLDSPNVTIHEAIPFTGLFKADAAFRFSHRWKVLVEAGYRDLITKPVTPSSEGQGSDLFEDSSFDQQAIRLDFSGLIFGVGLQFEL